MPLTTQLNKSALLGGGPRFSLSGAGLLERLLDLDMIANCQVLQGVRLEMTGSL